MWTKWQEYEQFVFINRLDFSVLLTELTGPQLTNKLLYFEMAMVFSPWLCRGYGKWCLLKATKSRNISETTTLHYHYLYLQRGSVPCRVLVTITLQMSVEFILRLFNLVIRNINNPYSLTVFISRCFKDMCKMGLQVYGLHVHVTLLCCLLTWC